MIKFLRNSKNWNIFIASSLLSFASILRINGVVFFPAEIIAVGGYFLIKGFLEYKKLPAKKGFFQFAYSKFFRKNTVKVIFLLLIPWIVFIGSYTSYHDHFFGDPFTNYQEIEKRGNYEDSPSSLVGFETQDFENLKGYSKYLLPYQFAAIHNQVENNYDDILGDNWPGIISISLLFSIMLFSLYIKTKRTEILVIMLFIIANLWFFSAITSSERAEDGVAGRYMIPVFAFAAMMIGYLIVRTFESTITKKSILKITKIFFGIIIGCFFLGAFYFSPSTQMLFAEEHNFSDPIKMMERYPLDKEGITSKSVILSIHGDRVLEYNAIPFKVITMKGNISLDSIEFLKKIYEDGYDVYVFKQLWNEREKDIMKELQGKHGILLTDYSQSFCKIQVISTINATLNSDKTCLELEPVK